MKKTIYILLAALFIVGCSKSNPEPESLISTGDPRIDYFLNEGKLDNIFKDLPYFIPVNDSLIVFSGQLKNSQKFGFIGFNLNTKEKLFDLITFEHTSIKIDLPYGETKTINVREIYVVGFFENNNSKVIDLKVGGDGYSDPVGYIYFIKDNKVINIINPSISNGYNRCINVVNWNQNFLLRLNRGCGTIPEGEDVVILYTPLGNKIIGSEFDNNFPNTTSLYEILNDFEAITLSESYIKRIDLRKLEPIWDSYLDLSILDRPQIDSTKLIEKSNTHFTYELSYTEYSGTKGIIKFKVNIKTGEIEYL